MRYRAGTIVLITLFVLVFLLAGLFLWYLRIVARTPGGAAPVNRTNSVGIHYADQPDIDVSTVRLHAVYFVPADMLLAASGPSWKRVLESKLDALKRFYELQFGPSFHLETDIVIEPIIGTSALASYEHADTALADKTVVERLSAEVRDKIAARYASKKPQTGVKPFDMVLIMYQGNHYGVQIIADGLKGSGNGATQFVSPGTVPMLVVGRSLLESPQTGFGTTFLLHLFAQGLGISVASNAPSDEQLTDDITGAGRWRPYTETYVSAEIKRRLGIIP